jgi:PIN domain nuclease of toxin-antitoxin system
VKYLLDTHTVLWFFEGSEKLSEKAASILEGDARQNSIGISVASLWEFTVKHSLGKLRFDGGVTDLCAMIEANGWYVLPITQSHLGELADLSPLHRDPFDRLLIAVALSERMTFVTADENIQSYGIRWIW